jgi:PH (Pleckstrin Homology) domain-containing protein
METLNFRSTAARVGAWAWLVFAALNFADIAVRGRTIASAVAAAALLLGCGIAYAFGLRPRLTADDSGIHLHNPLRDTHVPWRAVRKIEAADALVVRYTDQSGIERKAKSWVFPNSPRARARHERRARRDQRHLPAGVAAQVGTRTPIDFALEQLQAQAKPRRAKTTRADAGSGPARTALSRPAVAALALPTALLALTIALAAA